MIATYRKSSYNNASVLLFPGSETDTYIIIRDELFSQCKLDLQRKVFLSLCDRVHHVSLAWCSFCGFGYV